MRNSTCMKYSGLLIVLAVLLCACGPTLPPISDGGQDKIRLNQIGYTPGSAHEIVLTAMPSEKKIMLVDANGETVFGELEFSDSMRWDKAGETVWTVAFTVPETEGEYRIYAPGIGYSYLFTVSKDVLGEVFRGSVKGLYYQRASTALPERYAGKWQRPPGHPDTAVLFHPFSGRVEGQISSPGGWYDAGDYNKYVLNGSFPTGQLLALYEDIGDPLADGQGNIPESGNGKSDYLDELKYELDWLLTMQDVDGGLWHKLTTKNFESMEVMPHEATKQRYIVGKGTAATLDFTACMAQAYRIYRDYDPAFAESLIASAEMAWRWAIAHPSVAYRNPPDVNTGEYGDDDFKDEFYWAASELFLSTQEDEFRDFLLQNPIQLRGKSMGSWTGYMSLLGAYSLLRFPDIVPASLYNSTKTTLMAQADSLTALSQINDYGQAISRFNWGSNSNVLNAAMLLAAAYQQEAKPEYLTAIRSHVDYILGKNAVGYSFVTGFGYRSPLNIHHRQSAADDIAEPVPGLLSGGPNPGQQDKEYATYPTNAAPMQSWVDQTGSYASNEICLNWNAPLTYVLGWLNHQNTK